MVSRFQTLVFGLKVLQKSYTTTNHVKKILNILPTKWRPKVTTIQEDKDLNISSKIKNLIKVHFILTNMYKTLEKLLNHKKRKSDSKGKYSKIPRGKCF